MARPNHARKTSTIENKKDIWSSLLKSVAIQKRTPEKHLIVLGGSAESQQELIESLRSTAPSKQNKHRNRSKPVAPPLANNIALGYTYRDIKDQDGEDLLARLSIYTLTSSRPEYSTLLGRIMTAETLSDTAVTIILDWSRPWAFITELRAWMLLLYRTTSGLETSEQHVLEDNNAIWRRCRDFHGSTRTAESIANLPLAPGEFDQPIGIPINVICCNTQAVEKLEKEQGFKEPDFDYILQYLRTILLKHGAGLIYTMPTQPGQLHALILQSLHIGYNNPGHESLANDYHSTLKHNVVDRERILVPPGWDSWGKIRIVGEGFDIEGTSKVWLQESSEDGTNSVSETVYTTRIPNPKAVNNVTTGIEIQHLPDQEFLAAQSKVLANLQLEDEANKKKQAQKANVPENNNGQSSISDHIGPVQFNMGGIQYDADEALRRIRERAKDAVTTVSAQSTPDRQRTRETTPFTPISPPQFEAGKDIPVENLEAYFASLVKGGRSSNSPRAVGSPRVVAKPSALSEVTSDTQS